MRDTKASGGPTWALPPRPPDAWLHRVWSTVLLTTAIAVLTLPGLRLALDSPGVDAASMAVDVATSLGALSTAYALLVEHVVRGLDRLRWLALGFGVAAAPLLVRSLQLDPTVDRRAAALALAAPALFAVTLDLARTLRAAVLPLAALAGVAVAVGLHRPVDLLWWGIAGLGVLGAVRWWGLRRPQAWVTFGLLACAAAAALLAEAPAVRDQPGPIDWVVLAAFGVPGLGLGVATAGGYGQQSRRWHQLEREVLALRTGSPLLPNRSVTPEDDEGLPSEEEVQELIDLARVQIAIQPVVELRTGQVVGHEALSRFGGRVPTDRWFKAASRYGLSGALERITLSKALTLLEVLPPEVFLAVNISPAALNDDVVVALLTAADLSRVVVEITEHEAVSDYGFARRTLGALRQSRARIAVDDTGAGFASLRHVLMLQPDLIKLDTSLTRGIERDEKQQALVRAVTVFAAQVGADVLAEGIEEQDQLDAVLAIGVRYGQGWHLGVPVIATT